MPWKNNFILKYKPRSSKGRHFGRKRTQARTPRVIRFKGIHEFKRTLDSVVVLTDNSATSSLQNYCGFGNGLPYFYLGALPSFSEFTALFDQYRITRISQKFIYSANFETSNPTNTLTATSCLPIMMSVLDYDDASPLSAYPDYEQYETYKVQRMDKTFIRTFRPKVAQAIYNGAFAGYAQPTSNPWIDCNSTGVQYYGHKYAFDHQLDTNSGNQLGQVRIITTVTLQCRDTR